jgi:hypothetical protein
LFARLKNVHVGEVHVQVVQNNCSQG